jgi:hypothetical protein
MPDIIPENVLIGVGWCYVGPSATAKPSFTTTETAPWRYVGATMEGLTLEDSVEPNYHFVEEQSSPTNVTPGQGQFSVSGVLAEATLENLQLVMGGTIAGSVLTLSDLRPDIAIYVIGVAPEGEFRSFYSPRAVSAGATGTTFRRTEEQQGWAFTLSTTSRRDEIQVTDI